MNLSRISKRVPHEDHRQTLLSLHEKKLKEFKQERETLPELEDLLRKLIAQYNIEKCKNRLYELYDEVTQLQKKVKKIRDNDEENDYLIKAAPYLLMYYGENEKSKLKQEESKQFDYGQNEEDSDDNDYNEDIYCNDLSKFVIEEEVTNKGNICEEYEKNCLMTGYSKSLKQCEQEEYEKLICECGNKRVVKTSENMAVCEACGMTVDYRDQRGPQEFRPEVEILSPFALLLALKSMMCWIIAGKLAFIITTETITC